MSPAGDLREELPEGWSEQFSALKTGRKVKCYVNSGTGQKFFSKDDLLRHIKARKTQLYWPQPTNSPIGFPSKTNQMQLIDYTNVRPEWLPRDWILEWKTQASGRKYKCYIEPLTGCKFYSKPEVLQHLKTMGQKSCMSEQLDTLTNDLPLTKISSQYPESKVEFENSTVEDLPEGWIKETKIQRKANGIRKDPFYIDPVSGYAFQSKRDVRRYLETGDITTCKILPKKRDMNGEILVKFKKPMVEDLPAGWIKETKIQRKASGIRKNLPSSAANSQKLEHLSTRQQLMGQGNSDGDSIVSSENDSSLGMGGKAVSTLANVNIATTTEKASSTLANVTAATTVSSRAMAGKTANALTTFSVATMTLIPSQKIPSDIDAERNKNSNARLAAPTKAEVSAINQVKNSNTDCEHGSLISQADKKQKQNHESGIRGDERDNSWNRLSKSYCSKGHNMLRRSSKRLAGIEPEVAANSVSIMQATSKADNKHDVTCSENGIEGGERYERRSRSSASKSISLKGQNFHHWTTEKLAMIEPKPIANAMPIVQALPKTFRSLKGEVILAADATEDGLADKPSEQVMLEPEEELLLHADPANTPLLGEPPNTSQKSDTTCPVPPKAKGLGECGMVNTDDGPVSIPEVDTMQEQQSFESGWKSRDHVKSCNGSSKCRNKKAFNLPRRSSKRLAGHEPELVANSDSSAQNLQIAKVSCRNETSEAVGLTPDGLACAADERNKGGLRIELPHASSTVHDSSHGEPLNKNEGPLRHQAVSEDQSWMLESNKSVDDKSELKLMASFGEFLSDPCLEFAYKTLTGEIPVEITATNTMVSTTAAEITAKNTMVSTTAAEITAKNTMVSTTAADIKDEGNMLTKIDKRNNGKTPIKSRKYKNTKKVQLPHRSPDFEHNSMAKASSNERAFRSAARKSSKIEAVMDVALTPKNSAVGASQKAASEAEFFHYDSVNVKTMQQHETLNNRIQHLDNHSSEVEKNGNKVELPPFFSYGDCWSDPCFEFAYKTLTGTIPIEYNLPGQSYFQQQADTSQTQMGSFFRKPTDTHSGRDGSPELPDVGLPNYFQTDISVHFDAPDKQLATQPQVPWSSPSFMPSGIMGMPSCSSIGSQQEAHLKEQKGLRGKVNS